MDHNKLVVEFATKDKEEVFSIVETFCEAHGLEGIDGLYGQLSLVKLLVRKGRIREAPELIRDFCEIAFTIWSLGQLSYSHIADDIAQNFKNGGAYGETEAYLSSGEGNYFKNFLLQLQVGLRLVEHGLHIISGDDRTGEPDYLIENEDLVLEVKAPSSRLALFLAIIKGVQQIEANGTPGIIIISLDHMVARGMITDIEASLPLEIVNIVISALPANPNSNTIGVIAEWCDWTGDEAVTTVQPIMNSNQGNLAKNKSKMRKIWQALSFQDVSSGVIVEADSPNLIPYNRDYRPEIDAKEFFSATWPKL
ncbi:hypothetical protein [Bacillus infantis]|uniref:hypothetical protein n=1 Tax=Bacillus infantis TaxID=324767 RepID=UPI003CF122CF